MPTLMNLTKHQLADLFGGGYSFPHEVVGTPLDENAREIRARYRGVSIIRDEARDDARHTYWTPMGVRTGVLDDALPTDILPDDFMPVTDLLSLVETIRSLDEVIDWVLREQAVDALSTGMDVPRELIDMPQIPTAGPRVVLAKSDWRDDPAMVAHIAAEGERAGDAGVLILPATIPTFPSPVDPGAQRPIATQYDVDRHAWKQGRSYADAWRYFETQGYDMSEVDGQYSRSDD